jgi:DNA-binding NtrC family response regulator
VSMAAEKLRVPTILLNIGVDRRYLARRREILASAGFTVRDAVTAEEALAGAQSSAVSIAIFGHRVPATDRVKISEALKRINPRIRLVVMYDHSISRTESADAILRVDVAPDDLIHTVEYLLGSGRPGSAAPAVG